MSQSEAPRVDPAVIGRLSAMMFIQFFAWGSWYVTAPLFLDTIGFTPADKANTYSVGPIAGIISPFLVGMIADRFFPTQIVLGVLHLLGAGAMFGATALMAGESPSPSTINAPLLRAHALLLPDAGANQFAGDAQHHRLGKAVPADPRLRHDRLDRARANPHGS